MMEEAQDAQNSELDSPEIWTPPPESKDNPKIEDVLKIYDDVIDFLKQGDYDGDLRGGLEVAFSGGVYGDIPTGNDETELNYLRVLEFRKKDLERMECGITITGDTSSGKTSLVNKVVGRRLVTPKVLAATSKICRIRNSETYEIEVLSVDGKVLKERTAFTDHRKMNKKLNEYTCTRGDNAEMYYIDIYSPLGNLDVKGNVMLVDTPDISGAKETNSVLMEFLPNAVGFIFVIDVSRAGGVEEDRLLEILQSIVKARYMMPCFEPDDVLFVINKWNLLQYSAKSDETSDTASDDSDDEEDEEESINEEEEIWNTIVNKIKAVWPTLTADQIFRLNLRNENTDHDTEEERNQFERFAEVLSQILERTKNKKVKMHKSLLFDTICNIDIGIQSRIHTAISDEENIVTGLNDTCTSLEKLPQKCEKIGVGMFDDIEKSVKYLSDKLYAYINSTDGKKEILNPVGKISIKNYFNVSKEVPRRFEEGVKRWMRGKEVAHEIKKIDGKILKECKEVQLELETARVIIMGRKGEEENTEGSTDLTTVIWLPVIVVIGALVIAATIVLSPFIIARMLFAKENIVDSSYSVCAQRLTKAKIQDKLAGVFKDNFEHRIESIFEKELPRKIATTTYAIKSLCSQKHRIGENFNAILRLRDSLCKIKGDLEKLT